MLASAKNEWRMKGKDTDRNPIGSPTPKDFVIQWKRQMLKQIIGRDAEHFNEDIYIPAWNYGNEPYLGLE